MKPSRSFYLYGAVATLVAAGLTWWLLSRQTSSVAPVVVTPPVPSAAPAALPATAATPAVAALPPAVPEVAPAALPAAGQVIPTPVVTAAPISELAGAAVPVPTAAVDEVAATERMYLAHASLRAPEVTDPDSEANRRILQTMVTKALATPVAENVATPAVTATN